jgi:hypothetical protein
MTGENTLTNEALAQQMDLLKFSEHQLKGGYYA